MLRVGLTGGLGSGKSAVGHILQTLGAQVSQSDEVARGMMRPGQPVFQAIVHRFGAAILSPEGELDRQVLARIAFEDGRAEEINQLVHPAVIAAQTQWLEMMGRADPAAVAVVESALIFETKHGYAPQSGPGSGTPWRSRFDHIVVVAAPVDVRRQRYIERTAARQPAADREALAREFDRRSALQWSDAQRTALADSVLWNDGSLGDLQGSVERLYGQLHQLACDSAAESM